MSRQTYLAVPSHNGQVHGDLLHAVINAMQKEPVHFQHGQFSLLARNFNTFLCEAIAAQKYDYFCMLHADILPMGDWLTTMINIMGQTKADILSAVVPIKGNKNGATSTALMESDAMPPRAKRYTLKEVIKMERDTWTHEHLVVNSGLMLVNLRAPWIGKVWFEIKDDVVIEKGKAIPVTLSEDWLFSLRARAQGAKIYATKAVKLLHVGQHGFSNYEPIGVEQEEWTK